MIVRKCDRCGSVYEPKDCGEINNRRICTYGLKVDAEVEGSIYAVPCLPGDTKELCPECYRELLEWLNKSNDDRLVVEMNNEEHWSVIER